MKSAIVYGGAGAFGSSLVRTLLSKSFTVLSIDFRANPEASSNLTLDTSDDMQTQFDRLESSINGGDYEGFKQVDAVYAVAGGWQGGSINDTETLKNCSTMWKQNVESALVAASLASKLLKKDGLLMLTGSHAALQATPSMLGYGISKAAVHHLALSLASNFYTVALLPVVLDTPANRNAMPNADFSSFTPLNELSETVCAWIEDRKYKSGSLISVVTASSKTEYLLHQ